MERREQALRQGYLQLLTRGGAGRGGARLALLITVTQPGVCSFLLIRGGQSRGGVDPRLRDDKKKINRVTCCWITFLTYKLWPFEVRLSRG